MIYWYANLVGLWILCDRDRKAQEHANKFRNAVLEMLAQRKALEELGYEVHLEGGVARVSRIREEVL